MLNVITLMGRLTAEPELRVAISGKELCRFTVAVDRNAREKVADFIPVVAFGSSAAFVEKYFSKGSMIAVQGKLHTGGYTDRQGIRRTSFEVAASEVSFCGERREPSPSLRDTSPEGRGKEADSGYFSTAAPGDFDEIVGDEE